MSNLYIKNYILSVINTVMGLLFPIITFPYVSRVLGPDKLGIINFAQSYGYYFIHFASFGINSYAIREVSKVRQNKEQVHKISNEIYNLNFFFSVLSLIFYFMGIVFVPRLRANFVVLALYSVVIFTNFLTLEWLLQSYDDYFFTTIRSLFVRVASLVAVFIFVRNENDYVIYMLISCVAEMGSRISALIYSRREYVKLKLKIKYLNFKMHIKPMFTLFTFRLVNGISSNLDKVMIGFMMAYVNVGLYSAGVKFVLMIVPIIETVGIVLFPKINISANSDEYEYNRILKLNYDMIMILAIPMAVGLFLISPRLILVFAGSDYEAAIIVSRIMSVVILLCPIGDLLGSKTLLVYDKNTDLLICSTIVAISNIVLNAIFIPIGGINGAAVASVISYVVAVVSRLYFTKRIVKFRFFTKKMIKYMIFTLPFVLTYLVFMERIDTSTLWMLLFVVYCIAIYALELFVTKDELLELVINKIHKKGQKNVEENS